MKFKTALKRYAPVLFLFYLIKGIAWLVIPAAIAATTIN